MLKKSVTVYPIIKNFYDVIKFFDKLNSKFYIKNIVALRGLRVNGKDVGYIDNRKALGYLLSDDLTAALQQSEALLITPVDREAYYRNEILANILSAIKTGKTVICTMFLSEEELADIHNITEEYRSEFLYFNFNSEEDSNVVGQENTGILKLYRPQIPVVFIGEAFPVNRSLGILLGLKIQFEELGYKITVVSNTHYGEILQTVSFPKFFSSSDMPVNKKMLKFNDFIKNLIQKTKPDILLVDIPEPMIIYDDLFTNGFGVYPYMISQVLAPDYFILIDKYFEANNEFYKKVDLNFRKRFGYKIDAVCITNRLFDYIASKSHNKILLRDIDYKLVESLKIFSEKNDILILSTENQYVVEHITELIIDKLS